MELVEDLPRPQHYSSQSVAQAAALMSQLSDVVARRRDRVQPDDGQTSPITDIRSTTPLVDEAGSLNDAARAATRRQLGAEAVTDAAHIHQTTVPMAESAVSAAFSVADIQTALAAAAVTDAQQAALVAGAAFPSTAGRSGQQSLAPLKSTPITAQPQVTRGR